MNRFKIYTAAVAFTAAVFFGGGCAMKRDVMRVEEQVVVVKHNQAEMQKTVNHLDSLLSAETSESARLRAELRSSIGDLLEQFRIVQANMNDLMDRVNRMQGGSSRPTVPITPVQGGDSTAPARDSTLPPPNIDCQALYDDSFINMRGGKYEEAIKGFGDYLKYCGKEPSADDALFWIGEGYYSMGKYNEAIAEFTRLEKEFPTSEKRPGARYKIARSLEELGQKKEAKTFFQRVVKEFPGSMEAGQASSKLEELK